METVLLDGRAVAELLDYGACIEAVERAFRLAGEGRGGQATLCGLHVSGGSFHVKAATLEAGGRWFVAKVNANYPSNPSVHGLPTIQGLLVLFDTEAGRPVAIMDSGEITLRRTAAATAVAARYLARADTRVLLIVGCGLQGAAHVEALRRVLPIAHVYAFDGEPGVAARFAEVMTVRSGANVEPVSSLRAAALRSDAIVTCTPSTRALLDVEDVRPGTFVAGVGADNPTKQELSPSLLAASTVVADVLEQCARMGDLHHALAAGALELTAVHAELGEVVAGRKRGRSNAEEITVFDSTGTALQDAAAAALVYERASKRGLGTVHRFAGDS